MHCRFALPEQAPTETLQGLGHQTPRRYRQRTLQRPRPFKVHAHLSSTAPAPRSPASSRFVQSWRLHSRVYSVTHTPAHTPVPVSLRPLQISATMQNARPRATTAARPWRLGRRPRARTATFPSALGKPVGTMMRACIVAASPSREWQSGNWGFRAARRGVSLLYTYIYK